MTGLDSASQTDLWGGTTLTALESLPTFLRRSRLTFDEARELFASVDLTNATIVADVDDPCDTSKMTITGLTETKLSLMSRLLRLRAALGWTIHEVEQTIQTATEATWNAASAKTIARLEDVRMRLRLASSETSSCARPLPILTRPSFSRSIRVAQGAVSSAHTSQRYSARSN
jgi:hypothetical protein